jgi:hypothetical protein
MIWRRERDVKQIGKSDLLKRERERKRERACVCVSVSVCLSTPIPRGYKRESRPHIHQPTPPSLGVDSST